MPFLMELIFAMMQHKNTFHGVVNNLQKDIKHGHLFKNLYKNIMRHCSQPWPNKKTSPLDSHNMHKKS